MSSTVVSDSTPTNSKHLEQVLHNYSTLNNEIEILSTRETLNLATEEDSQRIRSKNGHCLKPYQSETVYAFFLFGLGLSLLLYVLLSLVFNHSQISPAIIFVCGLLCFIPGCYYLVERYCFCVRFQRKRLQRLSVLERNDIV